jgi:hypothetical protein
MRWREGGRSMVNSAASFCHPFYAKDICEVSEDCYSLLKMAEGIVIQNSWENFICYSIKLVLCASRARERERERERERLQVLKTCYHSIKSYKTFVLFSILFHRHFHSVAFESNSFPNFAHKKHQQ